MTATVEQSHETDGTLLALTRQTRRLETACSIIQEVHGNLTLERVVAGIVENLVEVGGFAGAQIEIDATIGNFNLKHINTAGVIGSEDALTQRTSVFIRGFEVGTLTTCAHSRAALDEQSELLEFVLPTLFMGVDHAVAFAEVLDYRATLELRVAERTAELAETHRQLLHTVADLQDAKAARNRFFANINHEIRTPLTLIQLAADGVRRSGELVSDATRQRLDEVDGSTRRLLHLVDSLLLLAAGDEGKLHIYPRPIDVAGCLQRLVRNWTSAAERAAIVIAYTGPDECAASLDESALDTIVGNLLSNAVKFTPSGGRVSVTLTADADTVTIRVRDTGSGIDPEFAPRLFSRFERSPSAIGSVRGSGIGLSLSKELVELHRGTIRVVRDAQPAGTCFEVMLPRHLPVVAQPESRHVVQHHELPAAVRRLPVKLPRGATRRSEALILMAEDDPALARNIEEILSEKYDVLVASNGRDALELAAKHIPDMLVTDLEMPQMDGLELTRRFLDLDGTLLSPVLIVSAHSGLVERLAGFDAGAVDYIMKPFSSEELLARVRSQLAIRKLALKLHETEKFAAMGMLSAGLAHELRNPANAVINALEPLWNLIPESERRPNTSGDQLYEVTKTAATQIRELCRNILESSTAGTVARRPEDVRRLIRNARTVLDSSLVGLTVVERITVELVHCAGPLIIQVLINLIDNAAYAAGRGGTIEIVARPEGERVVIEVSDSGPGVPIHLHERIFDPFFTTKPPGEGTGLGLSVSRRIALNHGGDLRIVRARDGSLFRLELPGAN